MNRFTIKFVLIDEDPEGSPSEHFFCQSFSTKLAAYEYINKVLYPASMYRHTPGADGPTFSDGSPVPSDDECPA